MAGRVIVLGDLADRYEVERLLAERHPDLHVETVGEPRQLTESATAASFDVALLLRGAIAANQERIAAVEGLRRAGFPGRVLVAGAFLTERQEGTRAGADYAFDPGKQATEEVVAAALYRPLVAADHPYLQSLFVGEWARVAPYAGQLPGPAPDLLLVATSCHGDPAFYPALAAYVRAHPGIGCILVDDGGSEEARSEALATGVNPHVVLAEEGIGRVAALSREVLRERWLAHVAAA